MRTATLSFLLLATALPAHAATSSNTRGWGQDCNAYATCDNGQQISCNNSGVPGTSFSICVAGEGDAGQSKTVFCSVDDGNGTITSSAWNSCI